jgi:hypothetical protein
MTAKVDREPKEVANPPDRIAQGGKMLSLKIIAAFPELNPRAKPGIDPGNTFGEMMHNSHLRTPNDASPSKCGAPAKIAFLEEEKKLFIHATE